MPPPAPPSAIDDAVLLERVRIFFGHAGGNMVNILVGGALLGIVMRHAGTDARWLTLWSAVLVVLAIGVGVYERHVRTTGLTAENCAQRLRLRIGLGGCVGLLYGATAFLLPGGNQPAHDTFIFIILSTLITVGALGYAVVPAYFVVLNLVSLLPASLVFFYRYWANGDDYYLLLAGSAVLWQLIVLKKAHRVSQTAIDAIVLNQRLHSEIADHKRSKDAMRHMALHDALTGLANRRYYGEVIDRSISLAQRDGSRIGLLIIDLDQFKPINDVYGHQCGDQLLIAVARRIQGVVRGGDFCARLGGDEFAVIVTHAKSAGDVAEVADKVRAAIAEPVDLATVSLHPTASVGWALYPADGADADALSRIADQRMYREKHRQHAAHGRTQ